MPDTRGLILQRIELQLKQRLNEIRRAIQQQRHASRMARVQSEVPCLLVFQPNRARRSETALFVPRFHRAHLGSVVHFGASSAAARKLSPAKIPRPPLYVGITGLRAISVEK